MRDNRMSVITDVHCKRASLQKYTSGYIAIKTKNKLRGMSPRVNYTDRVTATCRRS
jgi:hypothetical protein